MRCTDRPSEASCPDPNPSTTETPEKPKGNRKSDAPAERAKRRHIPEADEQIQLPHATSNGASHLLGMSGAPPDSGGNCAHATDVTHKFCFISCNRLPNAVSASTRAPLRGTAGKTDAARRGRTQEGAVIPPNGIWHAEDGRRCAREREKGAGQRRGARGYCSSGWGHNHPYLLASGQCVNAVLVEPACPQSPPCIFEGGTITPRLHSLLVGSDNSVDCGVQLGPHLGTPQPPLID